jgi:uncharacterized membrane protein
MKTNSELRAFARSQLKGSWLTAVGVILIYFILFGASNILPGIGALVITGPLTFGLMSYFLNKARGESAEFENLFDGFKVFIRSFLLCLLEFVFIMLWTLLFIVPGIIKSFSYSMAYFILKDNPDIGANEAITRSRKMMAGHKGKLFLLYLSFIGWILLCCLTLGIGILWLYPYMTLSVANFYEDLKKSQPNVS